MRFKSFEKENGDVHRAVLTNTRFDIRKADWIPRVHIISTNAICSTRFEYIIRFRLIENRILLLYVIYVYYNVRVSQLSRNFPFSQSSIDKSTFYYLPPLTILSKKAYCKRIKSRFILYGTLPVRQFKKDIHRTKSIKNVTNWV